jgi:predicted enzyme related to lactoylglutathione lyase
MIGGMHTIVYSKQADAVRAFFRDVLEFPSVDAGHGWLIFATPPSELAVHPAGERGYNELYLLCADIKTEVARLEAKGVEFPEPITEQRWGLLTKLRLPDGETLGLYQPRHPMAIRMRGTARPASSKKKRSSTPIAKGRKRKPS